MTSLQDLFRLGMKRELDHVIPFAAPRLELGPGRTPVFEDDDEMRGSVKLDWPAWNGETDDIPFNLGHFQSIIAFHFFEHFTGPQVIRLLRECERVLRPGGVLTTVIPHRLGSMAFHDLDHKSYWTEDSWRILFGTPYYDKNRDAGWHFRIRLNVIMGVVERNLCLVSQLERT